ncbi:hypothetical protein BAUCODRAFT_555474 [Baudoinia panamericana UAMH 10762]|uniref:Uncharacterized protein n=1 Tax=Baudoinia panamericana (strain UAMH 10762) TaxID=717646 RepID=M2N6J1_BAUPA|nr:uncharacterized protein BAUCODRAFT_555474 [Baudoinia panamericana UAMH 10762]EMC94674.1 hypothetical protein BAUCODRAFT_555474 [Baudoinia panamericana UAMH 10762]
MRDCEKGNLVHIHWPSVNDQASADASGHPLKLSWSYENGVLTSVNLPSCCATAYAVLTTIERTWASLLILAHGSMHLGP